MGLGCGEGDGEFRGRVDVSEEDICESISGLLSTVEGDENRLDLRDPGHENCSWDLSDDDDILVSESGCVSDELVLILGETEVRSVSSFRGGCSDDDDDDIGSFAGRLLALSIGGTGILY